MSDKKEQLEDKIMELVHERGRQKTICPSEAARAVAPGNWRPLMQPVREVAISLHKKGKIRTEQSGEPVDPSAVTGPIRLRIT